MISSTVAAIVCAVAALPPLDFLDQHDMIWEVAPLRWLEGIPLGNGHIGALVWGDGAPLTITLDRYDAWETRERVLGEGDITYDTLRGLVAEGKREEAKACLWYGLQDPGKPNAPHPTRLPMPRLEIAFAAPAAWEEARLGLRSATAILRLTVDGKPVTITMAVHAEQNLLVLRLSGEAAAQARVRLGLDHLNEGVRRLLRDWGYEDSVAVESEDEGSLTFRGPTGYEYAVAWRRARPSSDEHVICAALLSNEDDQAPLEAARRLARRACSAGGDLSSHEDWWQDYWTASFLTIPDARLEALYFAEMYKLGSATRPGGYPITLQGLWTLDGGMPPWSGDYHLDMNVQQTYWPVYTANRLEFGEPLYRMFSACLPRWRAQCKQFFGFEGIWSGCAIGPRGERVFGYSGVELWPGNAAWLAHHYWLHFLYSQDRVFLREHALPIMKLAFLTYANLLEPDENGVLHIPLSYSPEWGEGSFDAYCQDPTCDVALIRFLGEAILKSNDVLGAEDELTPRVREVLAQLVDMPQADGRLLVSAGTPLSHSHRHHSHLMGVYPLGILHVDRSESDKALVDASLFEIRRRGTGEWTGWAFPWMSLIASRAGRGNMAWQMLDVYANGFISPNTFHVNGDPRIFGLSQWNYEPMTLEAGFGAAAATMEMLLQSHGGRIRVFPSMPDRWHDAYFTDLRAEGAFLVTSKYADDTVSFVRIQSEVGGACELLNPFQGSAQLECIDREGAVVAQVAGDVLAFETDPGERYLLYPEGRRPADSDTGPLTFLRTEDERNFFGLKRRARY